MAISERKITVWTNPVSDLPDQPSQQGMTAEQLKAAFDSNSNQLKEALNGLIGDLLAEGAELMVSGTEGLRRIRINGDGMIEVSADGEAWEATASSGHIILDGEGNEKPQRSRLQFLNTEITDDGSKTVIRGMTGPQGPEGPQGPQGVKGETGGLGPVIVPSVDENGVMRFSIQSTAIAPEAVSVRGPQGPQGVQGAQGPTGPQGIQGIAGATGSQGPRGAQGPTGPEGATGPAGPQGPQGPQGERGNDGADGRSLCIADIYPTLGELKAALPEGDENAYQVAADKELYIWSEQERDWVSLGQLQGPQGPQGPAGEQGPMGATGPTGPQGPEGPEGPQGPQGVQGIQGPQGVQGPAGTAGKSAYTAAVENGYSGTEAAFNAALAGVDSLASKTEAEGYVSTHNSAADAHGALFAAKADLEGGKVKESQIPALAYESAGSISAHNSAVDAHSERFAGTQEKHKRVVLTLSAGAWSAGTITVSAEGAKTDNTIIAAPAPDSMEEYRRCNVICRTQRAGELVFSCQTAPETDLAVNVVMMEV